MKFNYFHLMPWTEIEEPDQDWPVANSKFVPDRATALYRTYIDTMVYAEECGFDWIGCNEHHFSPYGLVPLLNPIRVAEEYAMLDVMSGGRLIAGFMRGIPHEYVAYNVAPGESWERLDEASELILKAWTEPEPFGWEGKHYKYRAVSIWPRPIQQPHPPILMSASSPESARFAARHRAKMGMVMLTDIEAAKDCIRIYRETAREHGWEPALDDILIGAHTCVA
ncbi:MAG: LLM class flavin-dependent oxidoreductase, partial [Defluviicoccus sp.]|nr:LLM class flavin-dependent oxidoreductase [Defluviicoccus sp.]